MYRGAKNNIPDSDAQFAATKIIEVAKSCSEKDLLLVLVSGGGSALLPMPRPPVTLEEKSQFVKELSRAGADIVELNSIRKVISLVKGGGLVGLCPAKRICALILSDVLGDRLDIIGSGPTVYSEDGIGTALGIATKYIPIFSISENIRQWLAEPSAQTPKHIFNRVNNIIIGNNGIALKAISDTALQQLCVPVILSSTLEGEARLVGSRIALLSYHVSQILTNQNSDNSKVALKIVAQELGLKPEVIENIFIGIDKAKSSGVGLVLLLGGETTVKVIGKGCGGRNQELALAAALSLHELNCSEVTLLSGGTDGIDGPCDAAGAVVTCNTVPNGNKVGLRAEDFLYDNDSYTFFTKIANGKYHLITGHTRTNIMDIIISVINPTLKKEKSSL